MTHPRTHLRHPCSGMSTAAKRAFEAIAVNEEPRCAQKTLDALQDCGLIERLCDRVVGRDAFGLIKVPVYAVPLPIHVAWCEWCAENVKDEDIA